MLDTGKILLSQGAADEAAEESEHRANGAKRIWGAYAGDARMNREFL